MVIINWLVVLVFALIVLGFCAYELHWKLVRFRDDMDRVTNLATRAQQVRTEAEATMARAVAIQAQASRSKAAGKG